MTKMKALGLGLLAAMALSIVGVVNAGADTGGHFTSSVHHTLIKGTENTTNHRLHFVSEGGAEGSQIGCDNDSYTGTVTGTTVTEITVTPNWTNCYTTGSPNTKFDIHENNCHFVFTIGDTGTHHTAHVVCAGGSTGFTITHNNCTIRVPAQTVIGVTYDTIVENGKHAVTLNSTVKDITTHYEGGICIFLGTTHESEMIGSVTVEGFDTEDEPVDVTATTK